MGGEEESKDEMRTDHFSETVWSVGRAKTLAFGLAVMAVLLFGLLLVARPAHAATFTVNSAADPGTGVCDAT